MRDYDPTTGRYLEADPLGLIDGASVYGYARQSPGRYIDRNGLEIRVYSADAWGIPGLNHTFVWSTETQTGIGANGSSVVGTLGDGVTDLTSSYRVLRLPSGMTESEFMDQLRNAPNWNNGLYFPFINDCHNDLERAFEHAGVDYPGAPNGRFDMDDDLIRLRDEFLHELELRLYPWRQ